MTRNLRFVFLLTRGRRLIITDLAGSQQSGATENPAALSQVAGPLPVPRAFG
jgi:hypothetical protein